MVNKKIQKIRKINKTRRQIRKKVKAAIQHKNKKYADTKEYEIIVGKVQFEKNKYRIILSKKINGLTTFNKSETDELSEYIGARYKGVYYNNEKLQAKFDLYDLEVEK